MRMSRRIVASDKPVRAQTSFTVRNARVALCVLSGDSTASVRCLLVSGRWLLAATAIHRS